MAAPKPTALPSPGVRFESGFLKRLGLFQARLASARERREGAGRTGLFGVGTEFVGYRPYRPGEDLRQLDWNLFARLKRPFVRVARREASEHWAVLLDTSASMGVGQRGKLQCAAELTAAIAVAGLGLGARVDLWTSGAPRPFSVGKRTDLSGCMGFLEEQEARGESGLAALVREPARVKAAGRVFALGDLLDLEPAQLLGLARRGRELFCAQILAPEELAPLSSLAGEADAVEWLDAESGDRRTVELDRRTNTSYERLLGQSLEAWGQACARHRAAYGVWSSTTPFEDIARELLEDG